MHKNEMWSWQMTKHFTCWKPEKVKLLQNRTMKSQSHGKWELCEADQGWELFLWFCWIVVKVTWYFFPGQRSVQVLALMKSEPS